MLMKQAIFFLCTIFLMQNVSCQREDIIIQVVNPRCENRIDPLGIDATTPHLSWKLKSTGRAKKQSAYQILVADTRKKLREGNGNLWDSGKVLTDQSIQVDYQGKSLSSGSCCYWKVRVWDESGNRSIWSEPASWEMGLLNEADWQADWIDDGAAAPSTAEDFYKEDPAPLFRYEFSAKKEIRQARLYISGLGYYEAYLNGQHIGSQVLDPGWTNYKKRVLYSTFDVTDMIKKGNNCVGVILGNGWYNPLPMKMWGYLNLREHLPIGRPRFIARLEITYTDGSFQKIVSDKSWKTFGSPVLRNNIYLGEVYDARKELPGWNQAGFDDSQWPFAEKAPDSIGRLCAQNQPPVMVTERLKPVQVSMPKPEVYIYDMGQNFAGWVQLKIDVPAGTRIRLRYGELLYDDGTLNPMTSVAGQIKGRKKDGSLIGGPASPDTAWQCDTYIARGEGVEKYTPRFTFHAFRYIEITGLPGNPGPDFIEGLRLSSNLTKSGSFECSNQLFNDIQRMTEWTFLSNVFSVQSDCPHRERFGYGGDIAATTDAFIYNFDMLNFYSKVVRDFKDTVRPDGMLTDTAPFVGIQYCGIGWALVHPLLLLELYQYYGDRALIDEQYETAKRWFELVVSKNDLIISNGLSDHESLAPTPTQEMVTPLYYQSATYMSRLAEITGHTEDVKRYSTLSEKIEKAYLENFHEAGTGKFRPNTQGSQSFALYTGLVPPAETDKAIAALEKDIADTNQGHLTTGIFGTKFLLDMLSEHGYAETANLVVNQTTFPGWGHMLANGATTLWEHWEFSDNIYSHNHPMFGSVSEWFYKWIAGIQAGPGAVGFDKIVIRPQIVNNIYWVKAWHESIHGKIVSEWVRNEKEFTLTLTIPVNTSAMVYLPARDGTIITESGSEISSNKHVQLVMMENGTAIIKVGSGRYFFESEL